MSAPETTIRAARASDQDAIETIVAAAYAKYVPRIGGRPRPMDEDYAAVLARGETWVAERGDEVVGLLVLEAEPESMVIQNVAVDPDRQGEGLGRALLAKSEEETRARGLGALRLYTSEKMVENIALYGRLGYRETGRRDLSGFILVDMQKKL